MAALSVQVSDCKLYASIEISCNYHSDIDLMCILCALIGSVKTLVVHISIFLFSTV